MSNIIDKITEGTDINLYEVHIENGFRTYSGLRLMSLSLEHAKNWVTNEFLPTTKWCKYDYIVVFGKDCEAKWQHNGSTWNRVL